MSKRSSTIAFVLAFGFLAQASSAALGQACHGTPRGTAVAFEYGTLARGNTLGINGALGGGRLAVGAAARMRDISETLSGIEGNLRLSMVLNAGPVFICPGIGLGFQRDEWKPDPGLSSTNNALSVGAGAGFGLEQHVYGGFSVIPYLAAQYRFIAKYFQLSATDGDAQDSGDTLSVVDIEYGILGRYSMIYGGIVANRTSDTEGNRPYMARWIVGVTFGGKSSRSTGSVRRDKR